MFGKATKRRISSTMMKIAASAAMAAALGWTGSASAQQSGTRSMVAVQLASARLADLEAAFWACEYAATTRGAANIVACSLVYDSLQERKFGGDFDGLVKWWQQNRVSEFRRLAAEEDQVDR